MKNRFRLLPLIFSTLLIACSHSGTSAPAPTDHASQAEKANAKSQEKPVADEPKQEVSSKESNSSYPDEKQAVSVTQTESKSAPKPVERVEVQKDNTPTSPAPTPAPETAPVAPVSAAPANEEPTKPAQTVTLSVIGDKQHGTILSATSVAVQKGDTVLDVLSRTMKAHKIQMEYSGMKAAAYVSGIDNLYEFDDGPKSGWVFKVNGKGGDRSAGAIEVQPGDTIEWLYTLDLGKDVGVK